MQDQIDYLVEQRFPSVRNADRFARKAGYTFAHLEMLDKAKAYRLELSVLTPEELTKRCREEKEKQTAALRARAEREEREKFYNQPHARADFEYWAKAAHWTLDEAVALSLGRAPEFVTWEKVKPYRQVSSLAHQYERCRELALRAVPWQKLFDPVLPSIFMQWAKSLDLEVPAELESTLATRGVRITDWQAEYSALVKQSEETNQQWIALVDEQREYIQQLSARIEELQAAPASGPPDRILNARERESLLRLVIGMAVGGYGHDPHAKRSNQTAEIASDLETSGVALDADTVRKWLKEAAQLLPPALDKQTE